MCIQSRGKKNGTKVATSKNKDSLSNIFLWLLNYNKIKMFADCADTANQDFKRELFHNGKEMWWGRNTFALFFRQCIFVKCNCQHSPKAKMAFLEQWLANSGNICKNHLQKNYTY